MGLLHKMINLSDREMSKTILAIITSTSAQLLPVFANAYADDTQNSDTDKVTTKETNDKGLPPPGVPVVRSDKQHNNNNNNIRLPPPGVPALPILFSNQNGSCYDTSCNSVIS
jgi:hypothetical protein